MRILLSPPDVGELEQLAVSAAVASGWVAPAGPDIEAFERDMSRYLGSGSSVALSSGTAALHLGLLAVGVQPGDEVFVSTFTFAASANAVRYCGAEPVFIDSEPGTWNMSPDLLAEEFSRARRINRMPKAVVVVDLYGQCADYDPIMEVCRQFGVPVVEDSAEALGASYKGRPAGTLGDVGIFSFNGNKIITTSGGGMLVCPDTALADRVRYLSTQARQPVEHYEHRDVGFNYRLSNVLAALGRVQLSRLPSFSERRRSVHSQYRQHLDGLQGLEFMPIPSWSGWNGWLTCVLLDSAAMAGRVREALRSREIECRPLWMPMHRQPVFQSCRSQVDGTSERLADRGVCLPSGSALSDEQVHEVATLVCSAVVDSRRSNWFSGDDSGGTPRERTA
ncbi:MAG: DegT/DnrJ/EryC1/StrS family aminotransferase [Ilumatobacteraceae bacterium]